VNQEEYVVELQRDARTAAALDHDLELASHAHR
jgi:hypothetical protein